MHISQFDYDLPPELIAQRPAVERTRSRMLTLSRDTGETQHRIFSDFPAMLSSGDCLVLNDTRVFKARLLGGKRVTGGVVEIFLVRALGEHRWLALAKPGGKLRAGEHIHFGPEEVTFEEKLDDGSWVVRFSGAESEARIMEQYGNVPLPPYIHRPADELDRERYQTVFANPDKAGAVAAPTAGLHFSHETITRLEERDVRIAYLTLHVGPGTFKPVVSEDINEHTVDPEWAELGGESCATINSARENGGRIVAVGTTVVRTLEYAALKSSVGTLEPYAGMVDLYIKPGFEFKVVDELLTNFHLPKSSLLILASAFAGRERVLRAYREAVEKRYRFYSYGDCMYIHRRDIAQ